MFYSTSLFCSSSFGIQGLFSSQTLEATSYLKVHIFNYNKSIFVKFIILEKELDAVDPAGQMFTHKLLDGRPPQELTLYSICWTNRLDHYLVLDYNQVRKWVAITFRTDNLALTMSIKHTLR